ncbi:MAG TPA: YbbC/YhhH family protein [Candidatus Didemnitutus sp.]|nr:YbbC/YhhH family protein [Candidatus Didemnitutus sp.]
MKIKITLVAVILAAAVMAYAASKPFFKPKNGFVPDERTAIAVAVAVWSPVYGEEHISSEKPYHAELIDGVWHVDGSLPSDSLGGVAHAEIAKEDGRILDMWHGQ